MIKVTLGDKPAQESKPFPKLMVNKYSGCIVLFDIDGCGICIDKGTTSNKQFEYATDWKMEGFADYNEPITLVNT